MLAITKIRFQSGDESPHSKAFLSHVEMAFVL